MRGDHGARRLGAFVFGLLAFAWLVAGASPAHFWLDSGEIGAAGAELGVVHPPGAPGLVLLLRAATVVPIGTLGFRMAVASCLLAAVAIALVVAILRRRGADTLVCAGAAVWVACGLTFVRNARVVEIYAFGGALVLAALWGLDPAGRTAATGRRLVAVACATWAAWSLGDARLVLGPLVAIAWVVALVRGRAWARWAPLVAVVGTLPLLALPLASAHAPVADWGDPDTLAAFVDHLSARSIRVAYADEILPASVPMWLHNAGTTLARLAEDLGPAGPALALLGLIAAWRREGAAALAIAWVVLAELFFAIGINPMGGEDRQSGVVIALVAAVCVGVGLQRAVARVPRLRPAVVPLAFAVLVLPAALIGLPDLGVTRSWAPHAWTRAALAQLPPGTLLLTQSDDLAAGTLWARVLEGARPDVISLPAQHLHKIEPARAAERAAADPRVAVVGRLSASASDETGRIVAVLQSHRGPLALELPATGLFQSVPAWPLAGRIPLGVAAAGAPWPRSMAEEIDAWLPRLPSVEDRKRLATAVAGFARGLVRAHGDVATATAALELAIEVAPDHASTLVALATLKDAAGDTAGAIVLTRRALELEPDRHAALTNLALFLARNPATLDAAEAAALRAVALRPSRVDGWQRLADVRTARGDVAGAQDARARAQGL